MDEPQEVTDEEIARALDELVAEGVVFAQVDEDGVTRYGLTQKGRALAAFEFGLGKIEEV